MQTMTDIKAHYHWEKLDEKNLAVLGEVLLPHADRMADLFYDYLTGYEETGAYFPDESSIQHRKETIKDWFTRLFAGRYDNIYFRYLQRIGKVHVKIGLPMHWVNASMNYIRSFCVQILEEKYTDPGRRLDMMSSFEKILDINLDIMTSSYREEELKHIFVSRQLEGKLISLAERLTYGLNLILVMALMGISIGVIGLFIRDLLHLSAENLETGILTALGTLLIIWVMIELMGTEIRYLKGGKFHIEIFISVALVAFIRELLIASLAHETLLKMGVMLAAILTLGIVYYLISRVERKT